MAKFKVGDRVRLLVSIGDTPEGAEGVITEGAGRRGVFPYLAVFTGARLPLEEDEIELVVPETPQVGDTVRFTYEGSVTRVFNDGVEVDYHHHVFGSDDAEVEVIKKAEPEYVPGALYIDSQGYLWYRNADSAPNEWTYLDTDGCKSEWGSVGPNYPVKAATVS